MSFFSKMFGGKKEATITTGDAIQKLRETENMLQKKQEYLEKKVDEELALAKKNGTKNKRGKDPPCTGLVAGWQARNI